MVNIALWQLVLFVLAGVAVGAIVVMLVSARGKKELAPIARPAAKESAPVPTPSGPIKADSATVALATAATRPEKVKAFLKRRITNQRNVTVDETAKCLSVSPRRVRKLLDNGTLVAIPMASGRLVSSVSVLDLVVRRENAAGERTELKREPTKPVVVRPVVTESTEKKEFDSSSDTTESPPPDDAVPVEPVAVKHLSVKGLKPSPHQSYWYFVAGYDKPCRSIREALAALGLAFQYTDWRSIPSYVRKKIQREKVVI